ncbi:MAG: hypothetical protein WB646_11545 [Steroidobacteraceae bacterium]
MKVLLRYVLDYNATQTLLSLAHMAIPIEERTARLTILIDPRKKSLFERLCAEEDATPSQVVRRLIRRYIEEKTGRPWVPMNETRSSSARTSAARRNGRG